MKKGPGTKRRPTLPRRPFDVRVSRERHLPEGLQSLADQVSLASGFGPLVFRMTTYLLRRAGTPAGGAMAPAAGVFICKSAVRPTDFGFVPRGDPREDHSRR